MSTVFLISKLTLLRGKPQNQSIPACRFQDGTPFGSTTTSCSNHTIFPATEKISLGCPLATSHVIFIRPQQKNTEKLILAKVTRNHRNSHPAIPGAPTTPMTPNMMPTIPAAICLNQCTHTGKSSKESWAIKKKRGQRKTLRRLGVHRTSCEDVTWWSTTSLFRSTQISVWFCCVLMCALGDNPVSLQPLHVSSFSARWQFRDATLTP